MSVESEAFVAHVAQEGQKVYDHLNRAMAAMLYTPEDVELDIDFNEERSNTDATIQQE